MKVIGERLKILRIEAGLSQAKIGQLLSLPQASIYRYEHGLAAPTPKTFRWYADYFDVSLDYIYGRTDDPHGVYYEYKPKFAAINSELEEFVEMCFDPNSRMNAQLKETLLMMLAKEVHNK